MPTDWDAIEREVVENNRRLSDSVDQEAMRRKREAEFERGVRLGWHDKDGNSLLPEEPDEDDLEEE